jgi:putative membrane protein
MRTATRHGGATGGRGLRRALMMIAAPLSAMLCPQRAWAHGAPLDRPVGWQDWNWDPVILINLAVILWLYCRGWAVLRGRGTTRPGTNQVPRESIDGAWANRSMGPRPVDPLPRGPYYLPSQSALSALAPGYNFTRSAARPSRAAQITAPPRVALFACGMVILSLALISPLDPLGEQLGWAHMVQHMIFMTVAAPLLVAAAPTLVIWCGLPPAARRAVVRLRRTFARSVGRWLWSPLAVWTLYAIVTWIWHVPLLYQAALQVTWIHDLQHLSFFIAACLFWRLLLDPISRLTLHGGLAVLFLFTTTLHATILGVFMTVAPTVWYPQYEGRTLWWGLTALEDQQLAGLIMWMPACATYALVAIGLFAKALQDPTNEPCDTWCKAMVTP